MTASGGTARNRVGEVNLMVLPNLTDGMTVGFPRPLGEAQQRLMDTLGVRVVVTSDGEGTIRGVSAAAALDRMDEGLPQEPSRSFSGRDLDTANCKVEGCDKEARWKRGKFSYLCETHATEHGWANRQRGGATSKRPVGPVLAGSDEDLARKVVAASAKVQEALRGVKDQARYRARTKKAAAAAIAHAQDAKRGGDQRLEQLDQALDQLRAAAAELLA